MGWGPRSHSLRTAELQHVDSVPTTSAGTKRILSQVCSFWPWLQPYLDVAVQTGSTAVWNLELFVEGHLQVVSLVCYDVPGAFHVGWEVLGIVWRLDGSLISMDGATTAW